MAIILSKRAMPVIVAFVLGAISSSYFKTQTLTTTNLHVPISLLSNEELRYIRFAEGDRDLFADDRRLAYHDYIRAFATVPTAGESRRLEDKSGKTDFSRGQAALVDKLLHERRNGFYIECGALDGEIASNSMFFEMARNWSGLLIEPNPKLHRTVVNKNRQANVLGSCLSPTKRPGSLSFDSELLGLSQHVHKTYHGASNKESNMILQCFPLMDVLSAFQRRHVDYFSLDIEGPEIDVLSTIDWTKVRIDIISVEYRVVVQPNWQFDRAASAAKLEALIQLFDKTKLYRMVQTVDDFDVVFARLDL